MGKFGKVGKNMARLDQCIIAAFRNNAKDGGIDLIEYKDEAIFSGNEFYEWTKHADLQGCMEMLYLTKGAKQPARDNISMVVLAHLTSQAYFPLAENLKIF